MRELRNASYRVFGIAPHQSLSYYDDVLLGWVPCPDGLLAMLQMVHAASNGGCRLVIGRRLAGGDMYVVLDLGRKEAGTSSHSTEPQVQSSASSTIKVSSNSSSAPEAAKQQQQEQRQNPLADVEYASVQLRDGIDTVILGSVGLW